MKDKIFLVLISLSFLQPAFALETTDATPRRVRIGVDIRLGFQSCIDSWTPVTEYLSKAIPECRFVIIPLASQQDLVRTLENGGIDFMALDPAMELVAEDRFGVSPLAAMIKVGSTEIKTRSSDAPCSGAIIRRADRKDIDSIQDLRGQRLSAVKPWSLTGWIAQWALLVNKKIDPQKDLKQVAFAGTHGQVVKDVLEGAADVGVLDADLLLQMLRNQRIPEKSLYIINRQGKAVPLLLNQNASATDSYPGRILSKAAATSDELAKRVVDALMPKTLDIRLDRMPCKIGWSIPPNYSKVRYVLQTLMGPHFADSQGFPLPMQYPAWFFPVLAVIGILAAFIAMVFLTPGTHGSSRG
jgi:two-component system sensor histidine kinase TtrS